MPVLSVCTCRLRGGRTGRLRRLAEVVWGRGCKYMWAGKFLCAFFYQGWRIIATLFVHVLLLGSYAHLVHEVIG